MLNELQHRVVRCLALGALVLAVSAIATTCATHPIKAQEAAELGPITAAHACFVEASWSETDCAALLHVARKRAARRGHSWLQELLRYSALHTRSARVLEVLTWPDADVPGRSTTWNLRWSHLRRYAARVLAGEVPDPCPAATQWGGLALPTDAARAARAVKQGRWIPARCAARTANAFFAERAR